MIVIDSYKRAFWAENVRDDWLIDCLDFMA